MKPLTTLALASSAALTLSSCGKKDADAAANDSAVETIRFSAIPDENTTGQVERFKPVADYLTKTLGTTFEFVPSDSYGASVEKFSNGDIQLAWFGGVSGVKAREAVPGSQAIISGEADLQFKSYFIAHQSTGLTESAEFPKGLADLTFTFGSAGSTSGCIMPSNFILENTGKGPMDFFTQKPLGFSGSHDKTALQVNAGTFQAGALNYKTYERLVKEGKIDGNVCVKVWETPPYADYNFTAHAQLGSETIDKIQQALLNCEDPAVLKALARQKLIKVTNETFQGIATVLEKGLISQ